MQTSQDLYPQNGNPQVTKISKAGVLPEEVGVKAPH